MIPYPVELQQVLLRLATIGQPRFAGGCVRDAIMGKMPVDFDLEVAGTTYEQLVEILKTFGATDVVGRSFGVVKLHLGDRQYDFSIPRRESRSGSGHRGFTVHQLPELDDVAATARRDFTINSILYDPLTDTLIDPHGGVADIEKRILRHTSDAFAEDPLRVLRAFQFAARFGFTLAPQTVALCRSISGTFTELPKERVWGEWLKWASQSSQPSLGLLALEQCDWLKHFPELHSLNETPQDPEWHPEGNAFVHTAIVCDQMAASEEWIAAPPSRKTVLMFAALAHDFGKATTTVQSLRDGRMRWTSAGHEAAGHDPAIKFLDRIGAPNIIKDTTLPLVTNHMAHHHNGGAAFTDAQVRRLAKRLAPATIDDLTLLMEADCKGRPPIRSPDVLARISELRAHATQLKIMDSAPRPILLGRHLLALGLQPTPQFSRILDAAFDAQIDGAFVDVAGGKLWLKEWLSHHSEQTVKF